MNSEKWFSSLAYIVILLVFQVNAKTSISGYEIVIEDQKQTCDDKYRITEMENSEEAKCKEQCDKNSECAFFFFNEGNWCILYKMCTDKRTVAGKKGSTYKKTAASEKIAMNEQTSILLKIASASSPTYGYVEKDKTEAKCIPTKDHESINIYAGMTGYDNFIGNPTDGIVDPGVKSRIFLHDCKFGYYSFISDVGGDLNCDSDFSMKTITTMDAYDEERTSSNKFSMSASLGITASYGGVKGEVSAAYSRATNADEQAAVKVINKYRGEIIQAKATCITHSVSISDNVRPLFTQGFINHLKDINDAIEANDEDEKIKTWKKFVTEFGTHFMRTTKLGSQIIYERRLESKATSSTEMKRRSECVAFEASASLKAEGYGQGVEAAASGGRDDCEGVQQGSDFSNKEGFEGVKIISRGSRPKDLHSWADSDNEFDPIPVERFLEPMTELFRNEWLSKSVFYGFERSLNGEKIQELFLEKVKSYCSLMLTGTLDDNCNFAVCTNDEWKNKCKNGGKCVDDAGLPKCDCPDGFSGVSCEEAGNVDLPAFDGYCLDASENSDDIRPGTTANNAKGCKQKCDEKDGCTAFSFKYNSASDIGLCTLYKKGPYTHGNGESGEKCYTMTQGYDKLLMMHCWEKKYDYYATYTDAASACSTDSSCMGIYDHGCEEKGYYLCPKDSIQEVWVSNQIKSCVYSKTGSKFCLKYQTGSAQNSGSSNGNIVKVEVSFKGFTKTFKLDAPKVNGDEQEVCDYSTPDAEVQSARIRQTKSDDGWLVRSLQMPRFVGSPFYYSYAMNSHNEMFWVDGDKNCVNDNNKKLGLECCSNKDWCSLNQVTGVPCCSQIDLQATGSAKSAIPSSYFGIYNYFDRTSNGKVVWKHQNGFYYLYPSNENWTGWLIGNSPTSSSNSNSVLFKTFDCDEMCPGACENKWGYRDGGWKRDNTIKVSCSNSKVTTT